MEAIDLQKLLDQAIVFYQKKDYKAAHDCYTTVLRYDPNNVIVAHNYGITCVQLGLFEEAIQAIQIAIDAKYVESYITLGSALRSLGKYKEAMAAFASAFVIDPCHATAYSNYANSLREFGKPQLAIPFLQVAQKLNNKDPTYRLNESVAHLLAEDLPKGWEKYDARWYYESDVSFKPTLPGIEYNGTQDIQGKKVLVYCEQGFGDAIQFARFIQPLQDRGAIVSLYCRAPVERLLAYNFRVPISTDPNINQTYDYHCPMMDLPKCFNTTIDTIPKPSMSVDEDTYLHWNKLLGKTSKLRVGIVWSSTRIAWTTRFRNVPLEKMLLIKSDAIDLVNLEFDLSDEHRKMLEENGVKVFNEHIKDFYDTAALISNLDLVVAVDTAVVHVAGSLGIPTWLLLADYGSDWRWFLAREDSPFYPSVRILRQKGDGLWDPVLLDIKTKLEKLG